MREIVEAEIVSEVRLRKIRSRRIRTIPKNQDIRDLRRREDLEEAKLIEVEPDEIPPKKLSRYDRKKILKKAQWFIWKRRRGIRSDKDLILFGLDKALGPSLDIMIPIPIMIITLIISLIIAFPKSPILIETVIIISAWRIYDGYRRKDRSEEKVQCDNSKV